MKSKQVGYVLMALIAIGIAGLILRIVAPGSNDLVLSGLLPISPDVVDSVQINSPESSTNIVKRSDVWLIGNVPAFPPKLNQLWTAVGDIDGAQLVSINPKNHERLGVAENQGTTVSFQLGGAEQASFVIGKWTPDVRLCYVRPAGKNEVYGIPCSAPNIFDPDPDGWRNPVVVSIPPDEIESITYEYPDESFMVRANGNQWLVSDPEDTLGGEQADLFAINTVLQVLQVLVARGFATDEQTEGLDFTGPGSISVRIATRPDATSPTTRVRLLPRDAISYYARTPLQDTVFILDQQTAGTLLLRRSDFTLSN